MVSTGIAERTNALVVDDDPLVTRMVRRVLREGWHVEECNDSAHALREIQRGRRYDVILCDVFMPGVAGEDFVRQVESISAEQAERIVVMSGADSTLPGASFLHAIPMNRRLGKPFRMNELRDVVADVVRVSGRWRCSSRRGP